VRTLLRMDKMTGTCWSEDILDEWILFQPLQHLCTQLSEDWLATHQWILTVSCAVIQRNSSTSSWQALSHTTRSKRWRRAPDAWQGHMDQTIQWAST